MSNWVGSLGASAAVGVLVFAATIVYLIDRVGWGLGLVLGWAPALLMGLSAAAGHFAFVLILAGKSRRRDPMRSVEAVKLQAERISASA